MGRMLMHQRVMGQTPRQRLTAERIDSSRHEFEHGNDRWKLERLLFADDGCHLNLSGTDMAGAGHLRAPHDDGSSWAPRTQSAQSPDHHLVG